MPLGLLGRGKCLIFQRSLEAREGAYSRWKDKDPALVSLRALSHPLSQWNPLLRDEQIEV